MRFGVATATYDAEGRHGSAAALSGEGRPRSPHSTTEPSARRSGRSGARSCRCRRRSRPRRSAGRRPTSSRGRTSRVEMKPVEVTVRELELLGYADGLADVRLVSSSGFYVRSLAHDLGQRLGCGAHLEALRRTRAGEFALDEAVALEAVVVGGGPAAGARLVADGPAPRNDASRGRQRPGRQAREPRERLATRGPRRGRRGRIRAFSRVRPTTASAAP